MKGKYTFEQSFYFLFLLTNEVSGEPNEARELQRSDGGGGVVGLRLRQVRYWLIIALGLATAYLQVLTF